MASDEDTPRPAIKVKDVTGLRISGNRFSNDRPAIEAERIIDAQILDNDIGSPPRLEQSQTKKLIRSSGRFLREVSAATIAAVLGSTIKPK